MLIKNVYQYLFRFLELNAMDRVPKTFYQILESVQISMLLMYDGINFNTWKWGGGKGV